MSRDDFLEETKRVLAQRSGHRCARPDCRAPTSGPQMNPTASVNVGVAAHITAAAPGGKRYDDNLTPEQRRHADNGIWLCQTHGKLIDNDDQEYTVELLRGWKAQAEEAAKDDVGKPQTSPNLIERVDDIRSLIVEDRAPVLADRLRRTIDEANPDLRVAITFSEKKVKYGFRLRDGVERTTAGTLSFPATPAGREGQRKWQQLRDLGVPQTFTTGEFTFTPGITVPALDRQLAQPRNTETLKAGPVTSARVEHVRIEALRAEARDCLIPFTTLRVLRTGEVESEVEFSGGLMAGRWTIIHPREPERPLRSEFELDLGSQPAAMALHTVSLARAVAESTRIDFVSLTTGKPLLGITPQKGFSLSQVELWEEVLGWLATINQEFELDLRFPETLDDETYLMAWLVATGITEGRAIVVPGGPLELTGEVPIELAAAWSRGEAPCVPMPPTEPFVLLGHTLPISNVRAVYRDLRPDDVDWRTRDSSVPLSVTASSLVYDFADFRRRAGKASRPQP